MPTEAELDDKMSGFSRDMEEAIRLSRIDRFRELAKQRSREIQSLCASRLATLGNSTAPWPEKASFSPAFIESILHRSMAENQHLIQLAQQYLNEMRKKIEGLARRKEAGRKMGTNYRRSLRTGNVFSLRG